MTLLNGMTRSLLLRTFGRGSEGIHGHEKDTHTVLSLLRKGRATKSLFGVQ